MEPAASFHYIYATGGGRGFLLDLIRRPENDEARLAQFEAGRPAQVTRHVALPGTLRMKPGHLGARMESLGLDACGCRGAVGGIGVDAPFSLDGRGISFVPGWVPPLVPCIPHFVSYYGKVDRAECGGVTYRNLPLVFSHYYLNDLAGARWLLISAPRFEGADLALELNSSFLYGLATPSAWLFFEGREYRFNTATDSLRRIRIGAAGEVYGQRRRFQAAIRTREIEVQVEAEAPVSRFVRLAEEGHTAVHTTLLGNVSVSLTPAGGATRTLQAAGNCLLEVKG